MYRNEYEQTLEWLKTAADLAMDYENISRCEFNLQHYNRGPALAWLQDMIREYAVQIDTLVSWSMGCRSSVVFRWSSSQMTTSGRSCNI